MFAGLYSINQESMNERTVRLSNFRHAKVWRLFDPGYNHWMTLEFPLNVGIYAGNLSLGSRGGTAVYKLALVQALQRYAKRHKYKVILNPGENLLEDCERVSYVNIQRSSRFINFLQYILGMFFPNLLRSDFLKKKHFQKICNKHRLDIIHFPATVIPSSFQGTSIQTVLTFFDMQHEFYPENFEHKQLESLRSLYRSSVSSANYIIASSMFTKTSLVEKYQFEKEKISVLPVGIDSEFQRSTDQDVEIIRHRYDLHSNYIIYPANPWPHKNHNFLMRVFKTVRQFYPGRIQLVLTGKLVGDYADLKKLATMLGISDMVRDLGFVPQGDMAGLYTGARVLVFPSLFEGFGIPVVEAMACGCPVAASSATSLPEVGGDAVVYFDPMDEESAVKAILSVLNDPALALKLSQKGIERARLFAWHRIIPVLEQFYCNAFSETFSRS